MINWTKEYTNDELNALVTRLVDKVADDLVEQYDNDEHEVVDLFDLADALSEYGVSKKDAYYWFGLEDSCRWSCDGICELQCEDIDCNGTWNEKWDCAYCINSGIV